VEYSPHDWKKLSVGPRIWEVALCTGKPEKRYFSQ